jgi:hypothetical protein
MVPFDNPCRKTVVAHGRLAMREIRLRAARDRLHGLQVMTFEHLAARLAGGFARPIENESLRAAIQQALPETELGELDGIKQLPGMVDAAADTLHKAWRAGLDLAGRAGDHPRILSIARLEEAVLQGLPPSMMRPADLVAASMARLDHAPALLGPVEIVGITELSPCWRPLLRALAEHTPVRWIAGPRSVPAWLDGSDVTIERAGPLAPEIGAVSASTAYHEAIEAMRWARGLLASGQAEPGDIAMAATTPADYDDHFLALRADANLDLHFVHGVKVTATREGQAAAALADILVRGLSQTRMRRLAALLGSQPGPVGALPEGWTRILPADAPLASPEAWAQLLGRLAPHDWPDGQNHNEALRAIIALLERGTGAAAEAGEALLSGRALNVWRKALLAGPAASLDMTLDALKQDDGLEASVTIAWMPASALAASPRPFVRLLGLNSLRWPRGISEDRLLADHIVPTAELDPLPVAAADRRDFETILATTGRQVVLSRARRDSDGRLLGRSVLLQSQREEAYLPRNAVPLHAMSETDRLLARPEEFAGVPQAVSAVGCWRDWHIEEVTPHDGLVRADHPVLLAILDRTQSASSLRRLLRNPLGYVWQYGMRWREPESGTDPLVLDALGLGDLVHMVLDRALQRLEAEGGLAAADEARIAGAIEAASAEVAGEWEAGRPVPPRIIWARTLDDARLLAANALTFGDGRLADARSYSEVPFGGSQPKSGGDIPWDAEAPVEIPDTGFRIAGYIDRLDISGDGRQALVRDYKTGRLPKDAIVLDGGKELQRCLYAFAVRALLGDGIEIAASLLYLRDRVDLQLDDPAATLEEISAHLRTARANLQAGRALMGPDTGDTYDDLAFALPANVVNGYRRRKQTVVNERLGEAARVWEAR